MPGKTCFVASGKLLAEVAGECRCGAQGRASKSVCLARTHTRTCLGSDFIQFDFLSVRVCVPVCVFVCVQRMHLISMLDVALPSSLA